MDQMKQALIAAGLREPEPPKLESEVPLPPLLSPEESKIWRSLFNERRRFGKRGEQ